MTAPFYLQSFVATAPGGSAPVTEVAAGQEIELRWDSNGTAFRVFAARDPQPVYAGGETRCVVPGRTETTTFVLAASVAGRGAGGAPAPSFEEVVLYDALTVTVSDPDLTPRTLTTAELTVERTTTLKGDVFLGGADVDGALTVDGHADLRGGATLASLRVEGETTFDGQVFTPNGIVGDLNVERTAEIAALVVNDLTVQDSVAMLQPTPIGPRLFQAVSDGLLVGSVLNPPEPDKKSVTYIWGSAGGFKAYATGGNVVSWVDSSKYAMSHHPSSFVLPVAKGQLVECGSSYVGDVPSPISFQWWSFGGRSGLAEVSEAEARAHGLTEAAPAAAWEVPRCEPDPAIEEILAILGEVADGDVDDRARDRFREALRVLTDPSFAPPGA